MRGFRNGVCVGAVCGLSAVVRKRWPLQVLREGGGALTEGAAELHCLLSVYRLVYFLRCAIGNLALYVVSYGEWAVTAFA
jgi:hypothetical protein